MVRVLCSLVVLLGAAVTAWPCTNLLVSPGASSDGSSFITYAVDSHDFYGAVYHTPAMVHGPDARREIVEWDTGKYLGSIPQPERTYSVVGHVNEHQVAIGETTFGGREELREGNGILDYGSLMFIALERARTAREAIEVITSLVAEFGYVSSGESLSIGDPDEVWILEIISKGPEELGAVWVARRVPDGFISAHANQARIRTFPCNDPDNTWYSPDVVDFARERGWYSGADEDFSFADVYAPLDFGALRFCEARVWSLFRRAAPSKEWPVEMIRGDVMDRPMPLWIEPDEPISVADAFALMRDHFEGTELDMTKDVGAGPFKCPYRWRPMTWELDGQTYVHERAISTQQTGYSFVAQMRGDLPDPIGGIFWVGMDDSYSTVYTPMYCGIDRIPPSFGEAGGSMTRLSWDSAFWVFNWVANQAYARYSDMIREIQLVQGELEGGFLARQEEVESAALELYERSPRLAREYLTSYSVDQGQQVTERWRDLGAHLMVKYLDGNVKDTDGSALHPRYPDDWYRRIVGERGDEIRMPETPEEE